jgi:hypothetical protein
LLLRPGRYPSNGRNLLVIGPLNLKIKNIHISASAQANGRTPIYNYTSTVKGSKRFTRMTRERRFAMLGREESELGKAGNSI